MKRIILAIGIVLVLIALLIPSVPVLAGSPPPNGPLNENLTVDQSAPGHKIPEGSIIHHRQNGTTEVYGPDNSLHLRASDTEAAMLSTPSGLAAASHIFAVPSGSDIERNGNATDVYKNGNRILRVVDEGAIPARQLNAQFSGWMECAYDWSPDSRGSSSDVNLNNFTAGWTVPAISPSSSNVVDYLFNAIENYRGTEIIQPVLGWNQLGTGAYPGWTVASWYGPYRGNYFFSKPLAASTGDSIVGTLAYSQSRWTITTKDSITGPTTLSTGVIGTSSLAVFCTLEGYNIAGPKDVPGDTKFSSVSFGYLRGSAHVAWTSYINTAALSYLPGLKVSWPPGSLYPVDLYTN
jgi:hypothetical protein